jgi:hypothetical protein
LAICVLALIAANKSTERWCFEEQHRLRSVATQGQFDEIRSGKLDCLVEPEPECIDSLLADAACAANVKKLYLGGDLEYQQFSRLRELPNLHTNILIHAVGAETLLEAMSGNASVHTLHLENCWIKPELIAAIRKMSPLKELHISRRISTEDIAALKGHPGLERLVIDQLKPSPDLVALMQSLPSLAHLNIVLDEESKMPIGAVTAELKKALPKCEVEVSEYAGK